MKTALVTGANRGIGREIAQQLAGRGFSVWAASRRRADAEATAAALGPGARPLVLDVSDHAACQRAAAEVAAATPRLDALLNNAAISLNPGLSLLEVDPNELHQTFNTNVFGALWLTQACAAQGLFGEGSRVVNVSSGAGEICSGMGNYAPLYSVSKTSLNAITCQLAAVLRPRGVAVNAVCPGWVQTDMGGPDAPRTVAQGADTPVWLATDAPITQTGKFWRDRRVISW
jgi:NAD(P)-dependent dehydrogenase (short-subunit alcohol dehydrogenase family)